MTRFVATSSEESLRAESVRSGMTLLVTVPPWKDLVCLDILVEADDVGPHHEPLVFSSQWMDVPLNALHLNQIGLLDGLHVTWPQNSANHPLQPPASVYNGMHGMVTRMDLWLTHVEGAQYDLAVTGAAEFTRAFEIETRITLDKIVASNDENTQDADVAAWFETRFAATGFVPAWQVQLIINRELHSYVAKHPNISEQI